MTDPFAELGIPPSSDAARVRSAFRRLALLHHPDRNAGDPGAHERFKRLLRAYRAALRGSPALVDAPAPVAGPRPDRFGCPSCGDTFPFPERCPRCARPLHDRHAGDVAEVSDPRVEAWVRRMETRRSPTERLERLPAPGLLAAGFLLSGAAIWAAGGPIGPALLFTAFAVYVALTEAHRLFEPPWARPHTRAP